ncbi:MAG: hypothetical protein M1834_004455 [Cirrosporium novae-zelandiae]|nr:MAG: hypothetical protein M1834_004455 [Cirrosporium novae-zelandiae]
MRILVWNLYTRKTTPSNDQRMINSVKYSSIRPPDPKSPIAPDLSAAGSDSFHGLAVGENDRLPGLFKEVGKGYNPLLFFPTRIPRIGLGEKDWSWLEVEKLQCIRWGDKAFQALQMKAETKSLMVALVKGHHSGNLSSFNGVVPSKGKGLMFLLTGEPGLGKTLTAESLAEEVRRPLYTVPGGELGTHVSSVENHFQIRQKMESNRFARRSGCSHVKTKL